MRFFLLLTAISLSGFFHLSFSPGMLLQDKMQNDSLHIEQLIEKGNTYLNKSSDSAFYFFNQALKVAQSADYNKMEARVYQEIGTLNRAQGNYDTARHFFSRALNLYENLNDSLGIAKATNNIGTIHFFKGDLKKALQYYQEAIGIFQKLNHQNGIADCNNNIGIIHWRQKNYDLAKKYYKEAAEGYKQTGNKVRQGYIYNNLGVIYGEEEEYKTALNYYIEASDIFEKLGMRQFLKSTYQNIGIIYKNFDEYKKALEYYNKSLKIAEELGDKNMIATIEGNVSELYEDMADSTAQKKAMRKEYLSKALQNGERALKLAQEIGTIPLVNTVSKELISVYKKTGNIEKALEVSEIYSETQDSLFNKEKTKAIEELEAQYQSEKKQLRIEKLEKEKALQHEKMKRQRYQNYAYISGIIVFLVFSVIVYWQYNQKKKAYGLLSKRNEEIQKQKEALEQQADELRRLNATKNKFFSIIAHDLKNPFNALLGNAQILKQKLEEVDNPGLLSYADDIKTASERGYNLLVNLLEWSRSQTGRLEIKPQNVYLNDIVQQTILLLKPNADSKNISIENNISEHLFVYADPNSVTTIIRNLLSNAIKYSEQTGTVKIYNKPEDGFVRFFVEDNGIGIEPEEQEKLFRIDETYTTSGTGGEHGTGLGLVLSKEFVEKNGGSMTFSSEPEKGTVFSFTLKKGEQLF